MIIYNNLFRGIVVLRSSSRSLEDAGISHGLDEHLVHFVEVAVLPGEGHAHVEGRLDDALGLGQLAVGRCELPVLEIARVGDITEELNKQTAILGTLLESLDL